MAEEKALVRYASCFCKLKCLREHLKELFLFSFTEVSLLWLEGVVDRAEAVAKGVFKDVRSDRAPGIGSQ